jgi:hypothetical protein
MAIPSPTTGTSLPAPLPGQSFLPPSPLTGTPSVTVVPGCNVDLRGVDPAMFAWLQTVEKIMGLKLRVTDGMRTKEQQRAYAQAGAGSFGYDPHTCGLGLDICTKDHPQITAEQWQTAGYAAARELGLKGPYVLYHSGIGGYHLHLQLNQPPKAEHVLLAKMHENADDIRQKEIRQKEIGHPKDDCALCQDPGTDPKMSLRADRSPMRLTGDETTQSLTAVSLDPPLTPQEQVRKENERSAALLRDLGGGDLDEGMRRFGRLSLEILGKNKTKYSPEQGPVDATGLAMAAQLVGLNSIERNDGAYSAETKQRFTEIYGLVREAQLGAKGKLNPDGILGIKTGTYLVQYGGLASMFRKDDGPAPAVPVARSGLLPIA